MVDIGGAFGVLRPRGEPRRTNVGTCRARVQWTQPVEVRCRRGGHTRATLRKYLVGDARGRGHTRATLERSVQGAYRGLVTGGSACGGRVGIYRALLQWTQPVEVRCKCAEGQHRGLIGG